MGRSAQAVLGLLVGVVLAACSGSDGLSSATDQASVRVRSMRSPEYKDDGWAAQIHTAAMNAVRTKYAQADRQARTSVSERCKILWEVVREVTREVDISLAIRRSDNARLANAAAAFQMTPECATREHQRMAASHRQQVARLTVPDDAEVSPAFMQAAQEVDALGSSTNGSLSEVIAETDGILARYAHLPAPDRLALGELVNLARSSAAYWPPVMQGGGGGEPPPVLQLGGSFDRRLIGPLAFVVGCDVIGAAAGAASSYYSGGRGWKQVGGQAAIWGVAGSATAYLGLKVVPKM